MIFTMTFRRIALRAWVATSAVLLVATAGCRSNPSKQRAGSSAGPGSSLQLDGSSGFSKARFAEPDPFVAEATLSAWAYFDELPSHAKRIFSIVGKSGSGRDLDLQAETDDRFHFYVGTGGPNTVVSTTKVQTGVWYRIDATYRAANTVDIYVNGAHEASTAIGAKREPNTGAIVVGANEVFANRFFHGRLDEVALFDRALTAAEISAKAHPLSGAEPGLVAAYRFEDTAADLKGKHDGQLEGGAKLGPPGAPVDAR
jgi:hypothetical protein